MSSGYEFSIDGLFTTPIPETTGPPAWGIDGPTEIIGNRSWLNVIETVKQPHSTFYIAHHYYEVDEEMLDDFEIIREHGWNVSFNRGDRGYVRVLLYKE